MRFHDEDFSTPEERERFIELAVASLTQAIDRYERAAAAISTMSARVDEFERAVQNEIDRLRLHFGEDAADDAVEREYAAWLNERGADLARRHGADWRGRFESAARHKYGPHWKFIFLKTMRTDVPTTGQNHGSETEPSGE